MPEEVVVKKARRPAHTSIKHVQIGDSFTGTYYVEQCYEKTARNGNKYSDLTLRDKSGSAFVRLWSTTDAAKGDYVTISASVSEYLGQPQIVATELTKVTTPADLTAFIGKSATLDSDLVAFEQAKSTIVGLGNAFCTRLIEEAFSDETILAKFKTLPCSMKAHYGVEGGLLAHTMNTTLIAENLASVYSLTPLEKSILLTASLLHEIGAVVSFEFKDCVPAMTKHGILIGVEAAGTHYVMTMVQRVKENHPEAFDEDIAIRITHAVASCSYRYVKPMTKEAIILADAYRDDVSVVDALDFIAEDKNIGEEFTAFDQNSKRQFYRGKVS